jgi:hypothetical protein
MNRDAFIPRCEVLDMNKELAVVRKQAERELLSIPGVLAVGVGIKQVKGIMLRELCFKVTVAQKKSLADLTKKEIIPPALFGLRTDVVPFLVSYPGGNSNKYRPLIAGSQVESSGKSGKGTLGCFARRNSDQKVVLLSNWHVLVRSHTAPSSFSDDGVGQPTHNQCSPCCSCNEIAKVADGRFMTDNMDAAIALLKGQTSVADTTPEMRYVNEILEIGLIAGAAAPVPGETVWKYGAETGLTKGVILNDNQPSRTTDYTPVYGAGVSVMRTGQFTIEPAPGATTPYFGEGDSGSVSVNEHNQVVLLNHAFNGNQTYATNIISIQTTLAITVLDSTFHSAVANKQGVPLSSAAFTPADTIIENPFEVLETEVAQYASGKKIMSLFQEHQSEILHLVNHHREAMTAWNRYQGPAFLAQIIRALHRNKSIEEQIKGIGLQNLILKMTGVLQRIGSPALVHAVNENYLQVMQVLGSGNHPDQWKKQLADLDNNL